MCVSFWECAIPETNITSKNRRQRKMIPFLFGSLPVFRGKLLVSGRIVFFWVSERNRDPRTMMFDVFFWKGSHLSSFFLGENTKQENKPFKQHEWHPLFIWEDVFFFEMGRLGGASTSWFSLAHWLIFGWRIKLKEWEFGEASFHLAGGFKYFLFSPLLGEDSHFD